MRTFAFSYFAFLKTIRAAFIEVFTGEHTIATMGNFNLNPECFTSKTGEMNESETAATKLTRPNSHNIQFMSATSYA
jgi:hypothetical protein